MRVMKTKAPLLLLFLLLTYAFNSLAEDNDRLLCSGHFTNLNQWPVVQSPKRVLLVPLLKKQEDSNEDERWPENPAALLDDFYRQRFHAEVVSLRNIRSWDDYYRGVNQLLLKQEAAFDRVILIGHGGFDGPVLKRAEILQDLTIKGSAGVLSYASETQPGKQQIFSLTYDVSTNKSFSDYITNNWRELTQMDPNVASRELHEMKDRLQPIDTACVDRYCKAFRLGSELDEAERSNKMHICQDICRTPLFMLQTREEIRPERFFHFADTLTALAKSDGLVFFGACNPGTSSPDRVSSWDNAPGFLIQSKLVGGPFNTYVHMFASASKRVAKNHSLYFKPKPLRYS